MKFISKNSNLHIILQPGQPSNPVTQTPPVPALSVRFQNGQADINDENLIEKMKRHPAFNQDFIAVDEAGSDPYAHLRASSEPQHVTTEILYGHPTGRSASPVSAPMPPELKKLITEQATAIAAQIVEQQKPAMMEEAVRAALAILSSQVSQNPGAAATSSEAPDAPAPTAPTKPKAKGSK